jgi:hypothetical protein
MEQPVFSLVIVPRFSQCLTMVSHEIGDVKAEVPTNMGELSRMKWERSAIDVSLITTCHDINQVRFGFYLQIFTI